ncbi:PEP-CTERM sorting domain-containing protein [Roseateles albus]|uniref:PEP-CTERM sorting domain-containing protein n=1 Tax=Roseateles albus TaxID=2987525 RepID=A0ABT5KFK2_9BURK|nr:PEP-CTERM sorting domain-containing protein [Roseateles albus]MDC8772615.1 PEP-CTERM sorting domain-containing protein [Roseateles albus]
MKLNQTFLRSALATAAAFACATSAQAATFRGFDGTSLLDNVTLGNAFRPPDTMGAVGTTQFLESTNGSYTVYDKLSGAVQQRISFGQFWTNAGQGGAPNGDQRILFDHHTNRWISIGFSDSVSDINIAVSDTSNAMGPWKSTKFTGFAGGTADYPTLGMDKNGVYIGTGNFKTEADCPPGFGYCGASLFVIPKSDLFGGAPTTANMSKFDSLYPAVLDRGFAIQGAVNWDKTNNSNTGKFLGVNVDTFKDYNFYKVNGVNAAGATQTASVSVGVAAYDYTKPARQPDGTRVVDTLDERISSNVVESNGKLYAVHTVTPTGTDHTAVRWSVLNANTGAVIEEGDISGGGFDYFQGSIAVNEYGQAVIGFNRSGFQQTDLNNDGLSDGNITFMARAFETDGGGGLDQSGADMLLKASSIGDYHCSTRTVPVDCRQRWGDYSAVSLDPTNHRSFYAIGEYSKEWAVLPGFTTTERATWNTYIAEISMPVPEPETYALMLAGLALVGIASRRHRKV